MVKKRWICTCAAMLLGFGVTYQTSGAETDALKDSQKDQKNVKTLQGMVVDLSRYLMLRADGKSAEEAAKVAAESTIEATKADKLGASAKVCGLLVSDKNWLSKVTNSHELYVLCSISGSDAAVTDAGMSGMEKQLGKMVQVTGRVYDEDGVRAICVQNIAAASASNLPSARPDNTAVNARDRAPEARTADVAGQTKSDVQIAADIRKRITDTKMSVNAKNAKIVVQNGQVTLRGMVKNQEEKDTIGGIANDVAGLSNVDNQLEVQSNP